MPDKLALLEEQGLIVQKEVPISHAMRIDMTEKGERFVALLKEADSLLS
jgi:predicted transcriptional regulator